MVSPIQFPPSSPPPLARAAIASPARCLKKVASSGLLPGFEPMAPGNEDQWAATLKDSLGCAKMSGAVMKHTATSAEEVYNEDLPSSSPPGMPSHLLERKQAGIQFTAAGRASLYPTPAPTSSTGLRSSSPPPSSFNHLEDAMYHDSPPKVKALNSQRRITYCHPTFASVDMAKTTFQVRSPLSSVTFIRVPKSGAEVTIGRSSQSCDFVFSSRNKLVSRIHVCISYLPEFNHILFTCKGWNGCTIIVPEFKTRIQNADLENQNEQRKETNSFEETLSNGQTDYVLPKGQQVEVEYVQGITIDVRGERALVEVTDDVANEETDDECFNTVRHPLRESHSSALNTAHPVDSDFVFENKVKATNMPKLPSSPLAIADENSRNVPQKLKKSVSIAVLKSNLPESLSKSRSCSPLVEVTTPPSKVIKPSYETPMLRKRTSTVAFLDVERSTFKRLASKISLDHLDTQPGSNEPSKPTLPAKAVELVEPAEAIEKAGPVELAEEVEHAEPMVHAEHIEPVEVVDPIEPIKPVQLVHGDHEDHEDHEDYEAHEDPEGNEDNEVHEDSKDSVLPRTDCIKDKPNTNPNHNSNENKDFADLDLDQISHLISNHLAFSRLSSTPFSILKKSNPILAPLATETLQQLLQDRKHIPCVGIIYREGKDAAGKPLEEEYYYMAEKDDDEDRKLMVEQLTGGRGGGLRACRKTHKQYYWKKPARATKRQ